MKLFGKKKEKEAQGEESNHDIYGGFTINEKGEDYEIIWRSPNLTTITVNTKPIIDEKVETKLEGNKIIGLTNGCKMKIIKKDLKMEAFISLI
jgi:hypothetical protein